ncbi:VanZ family protein [Bosea sp. 124]|uniref:VanZ family protein n=1 Tax=Bosea sp. 124 TaxID=2135642 RepID=UPI0015E77978|nr:VanZ family protein [Bosea sp. 124]
MNDIENCIRRIASVFGWSAVLAIAFVTVAPVESRPHLAETGPDIERFLAFVLLAGALAVAYPKRRSLVLALAIGLAIALEAAQLMQPSRHGRPHDAIVKVAGAIVGTTLAILIERLARKLRRNR